MDKVAFNPVHKNENDSFMDQHVKKTINFPSAKYEIVRDWSKDERFETNKIKGAFLKGKKVTCTEAQINTEKKKNIPGPVYNMPEQFNTKISPRKDDR